MKHYSAHRPGPTEKCQECGEAATVVYVSDYQDREGNLHEMPLCNTHAAEMGGDFPWINEENEQENEL